MTQLLVAIVLLHLKPMADPMGSHTVKGHITKRGTYVKVHASKNPKLKP